MPRFAFTTLFSVALTSALFLLLAVTERAHAETSIPSAFLFERTLKTGSRGEDVRYLQVLLNRDSETRVNAPTLLGGAGNETDFFGTATRRAVVKFQNKYAGTVLAPANLSAGTGLVGSFTRVKLNALLAESRTAMVQQATTSPHIPTLEKGGGEMAPVVQATTTAPSVSFEELNVKTRAALVNIICTTIRSGSFEPVSGSGVIIDSKGVILTNAHVAQYFLLKDYLVPNYITCTIRTGEPARNRYKARLLYISPLWMRANYQKIRLATPSGTGENDFALLLITESVNKAASPLPESYPFLPLDFTNEMLREKSPVLVAGYPAGFLGGINIQKEFYPSSSIVTIGSVFTFGKKTADVFSLGGSPLAQEGSSGGAVVSAAGTLIGLVATATAAETTDKRDLYAITPSHIAASFRDDTGNDIKNLLASDLAATAESFNQNVAPTLTKLLESALQKKN